MKPLIVYEIVNDHVALITLNRPDAANALSTPLLDELNETIGKVMKNGSIYCVIITGVGEKAFCAGADLKERRGMSELKVISTVQYIGETMSKIEQMPIPVIAAINGAAYGGGLELALACDLRIIRKQAMLGLTETSLAIIPGAGGTQRLPRLIGIGQAKRLIYTAKPIVAEKAFQIGLVEEIVEAEQLLDEAIKLAETIANNGPIAIRQAKLAINKGFETDLTTGLVVEHLSYKETIHTKDRLEGLEAFKEKRKPIYKGE